MLAMTTHTPTRTLIWTWTAMKINLRSKAIGHEGNPAAKVLEK
jgi:hypothetical protein